MKSTVARLLLLAVCIFAASFLPQWMESPVPGVYPASRPTATCRPEAIKRVEPELARAELESQQAMDRLLESVDRFFADVKGHTPEFSAAVLGWGSKWRFVADKLPFTRGDRHQEYLRETFARHLFADKDLARLLEQVASSYADSISGIENEMLVRIRQDLEDLPLSQAPAMTNSTAFEAAYQTALATAMAHIGSEVKADVAGLVLSIVVQEVMTQVAVRMGVSAGILSAGAGSSWATLGIGMVVGLIVDQIVAWVWDWWADPQGELTKELNSKLDDLHHLLVEGDPKIQGLRVRLTQISRDRSQVRRQAVLALVNSIADSER